MSKYITKAKDIKIEKDSNNEIHLKFLLETSENKYQVSDSILDLSEVSINYEREYNSCRNLLLFNSGLKVTITLPLKLTKDGTFLTIKDWE